MSQRSPAKTRNPVIEKKVAIIFFLTNHVIPQVHELIRFLYLGLYVLLCKHCIMITFCLCANSSIELISFNLFITTFGRDIELIYFNLGRAYTAALVENFFPASNPTIPARVPGSAPTTNHILIPP
jgi:hypothetical protein